MYSNANGHTLEMMYAISQSYLPKIFTFEHPFIYSFFSILGLIERKGNERTNI